MFDEIINPLVSTAWGRRLSLAALIGLAVLLLVTIAYTIYSWHSDVVLVRSQGKLSTPQQNTNPQKTDLVAQLPNYHLFGNAFKVEQSAVLPITSLQIRLIGIVHAAPQNLSRVIISEAGQPGKVFQVGDSIVGVKVNAIVRDGVILENGGRLEKLPLQRQELSFQGMPKRLLREE